MTAAPKVGGARPGAGRPRIADIRMSISLSAEQHAIALALGGGSAAAGIRAALDLAAQKEAPASNEAGGR